MTNKVAFTKQLLEQGYTQKQISIIVGRHPSWVQRIAARTTYLYVSKNDYEFDGELEARKHTFDVLLSVPEIAGDGELDEQDIAYIRILKYCGVQYSQVRDIYFDRPRNELRKTWDYVNQLEVPMFDGAHLNLREDILQNMFSQLFDKE